MIVAVKRKDPKKLIIKIVVAIVLLSMFAMYYNHMSKQYAQVEKEVQEKKVEDAKIKKEKIKAKKIEKIIFKEVETAIDLIGQEYVQQVKLVDNRVLIVCDANTNLEALKVRYGTKALIKYGLQNIKIAIDLKFVVESKLNEQKK